MTVDRPSNPIAPTSRWMAAARARESERADRLFYDPLAAALVGPEGFAWLYPVIRTRFFDDFLLDSCRRLRVRQVVLAAAGLDTRAFRLDWPSRTRLYEMDLPEVLDAKEDVIYKAGAKPNCERHTVRVDLRAATWTEALLARGYRPERPSVWLIEDLLYYLTRTAVHRLLERVSALATTGSLLGLDVMNRGLFFSVVAWPLQAALARLGAPGRFGTNESGEANGAPRLGSERHPTRRGGGELRAVAQGDGAPGGAGLNAKLTCKSTPLVSDWERVRNLLLLRGASGTSGDCRLKKNLACRGAWER